jgi:hypothetical protein
MSDIFCILRQKIPVFAALTATEKLCQTCLSGRKKVTAGQGDSPIQQQCIMQKYNNNKVRDQRFQTIPKIQNGQNISTTKGHAGA